MTGNPLYDLWRELVPSARSPRRWGYLFGVDYRTTIAREKACAEYAWAVPDDKALELISRHGPLVEIGAGTGYWAALLARRGVDILAYDAAPPPDPNNLWHYQAMTWFPVQPGGPEKAALYPERTLFLCWPPMGEPFAAECLRHYQGNRVIYVGESGGCTADVTFHKMLQRDFVLEFEHHIPRWPPMTDRLWIYRRRD